MERKELLYWIWASRALGVKSNGAEALLEAFGSPVGAFCAEEIRAQDVPGASRSALAALSSKDLDEACRILDLCEREGIKLLTYRDEQYPDALRAIKDAPLVLYYKGELPDMNRQLCVAMVGTRYMSEYGRDCAYKIAYGLAAAGAVIVSGMAEGSDGVCSAAALAAGGETVAFLGNGADVVYPKQHRALYEEICRHGAVISEYPPTTKPLGYHFPVRNRLISGASQTTLVVESGAHSGSLITAEKAVAQGRTVYALLTAVSSDAAEGAQLLLEKGAKPLISAERVLSDFTHIYPKALHPAGVSSKDIQVDLAYLEDLGVVPRPSEDRAAEPKVKPAARQKSPSPRGSLAVGKKPPLDEAALKTLSPIEAAVMRCFLQEDSVSSDVFYCLPYEANEISTALICLEIGGRIKKTVGSFYERV